MNTLIESITKPALERARVFDEPFVICKLASQGFRIWQGTEQDDWEHNDFIFELNNKRFYGDVKRNSKSNCNSVNLSFTYVNALGKNYPFKTDGYLAIINDKDQELYMVRQVEFEKLLDHSKELIVHNRLAKVKLVPFTLIKSIANENYHGKTFELTDSEKKYLELT